MALEPARTVAELEELRALTGDENGAQRVAWTETWERARELAARQARRHRRGRGDRRGRQPVVHARAARPSEALLIGGHIDSVPNGGWLDGCLNVLAGAEVLRRIADGGRAAGDGAARQLGRRGGRALRPLALRLVGRGRVDARPGRAARSSPTATGSRCRMRCASTASTLDGALDARSQLGERRAPTSSCTSSRGPVLESLGPAARRRARHVRRRALALHVARPGRARRLDADGQAPRRARRRGEARALHPRDRRRGRRRRGVHLGRRRLRSRGSSPRSSRPPSSCSTSATSTPTSLARMLAAGAGRGRAVRRRGEHRGRVGADLEHRADPLRRDADRASPTRRSARSRARRTGCRQARCTMPPRSRARASRR